MEVQTQINIFIWVGLLTMACLTFAVILFFNTHRKKVLEKEARLQIIEKEAQLAIFKSASEAEEKQKEKIGRNFHDDIIPKLSAVERSLGMNIRDYSTRNFDFERLKKDFQYIHQVIEDIRGISHDLVPKTLHTLGLAEALKEYIDQINGTNDSKAEFKNTTGYRAEFPFSGEDRLTIYRICLELINNLQKYAGYRYLKLSINSIENGLEFVLKHNGKGVTNLEIDKLTATSSGLGLRSLKSRTLMLEAKLNYTIEPDFAYITLTVPIKK